MIFSASGFGNFSSSTTGFAKLFPKIRSKFCTLNFHFLVPVFRDLFLSWGMISVKSSSIKRALLQSNDKSSACNRDGFTSNAVTKRSLFLKAKLFSRIAGGDSCWWISRSSQRSTGKLPSRS